MADKDGKFAGRIVLVTGASRGIGQGIAQAFSAAGAVVIGTSTSTAGAEAVQKLLAPNGCARVLDVADPNSIESLMADLNSSGLMPDILVNNAGIARDNLLLRMRDDDWQDVISTNLTSAFMLSKRVLRDMMKKRFGRIINIGSVIGSTGNAGQANYAASKSGITGLTKAIAREVGTRGITVNVVAPGFIDTEMTQKLSSELRDSLQNEIAVKRFGTVEDIAAAVLFLASDEAGYITGETLHVNGGMYMS